MAAKGCIVLTKYFLFVFNLFFFFLGGVMLGFGLWILFDKTSFISVLETAVVPLRLFSYVFSALGIFTMMMGFLGCIGSLKEVKCMLGIYFTLLVLLMASQITIGVLVYTQRNMIEKKLGLSVKELIESYSQLDKHLPDHEESWDYIQIKFSCCGWNNSLEWMKNPLVGRNVSGVLPFTYPCSCYNSFPENSTQFNMTDDVGICSAPFNPLTAKLQGCKKMVFQWIKENIISIMVTCISINVVELLGMSLSMLLCRNIDPDYDKLIRFQ
ncbi:leukocyte antigen CD37-like [Amblyraja radiata]|uniref:leukocyte antigen CD37-like n=1 Tax=Amblyraja radiata TaxID=386614 RepID=UPI001401E928|nr:leukocyte antigen CD37-like [Amblyraja radiata]